MELPIVAVIIKRINPNIHLGIDKMEVVTVTNLHAFPIQMAMPLKGDTDELEIEPRLCAVINGRPHLLTLAKEREEGAIIYETYMEYVEPEVANDEPDVPGDAGDEEVEAAVHGPTDGSGDEASGGDATPDSEEVHH